VLLALGLVMRFCSETRGRDLREMEREAGSDGARPSFE